MQVQLSDLENKNLQQIRIFFAKIDKNETELELIGSFDAPRSSSRPIVCKALSYLPKHITSVKFSGEYAVTNDTGYIDKAGHDRYGEISYKRVSIGNQLPYYITHLPESIFKVSFAFNCSPLFSNGTVVCSIEQLIKAVSSLNNTIQVLDISEMIYCVTQKPVQNKPKKAVGTLNKTIPAFDISETTYRVPQTEIGSLIQNIPTTVKSLKLNITSINILSNLPSTLIAVTLIGASLKKETPTSLANLLSILPPKLKILNLFKCELDKLPPDCVQTLTTNLPSNLAVLGLSENNLSSMNEAQINQWAEALESTQAPLVEIDLSENNLLSLDEKNLKTFLHALPKPVRKVHLSQSNQNLPQITGERLATQLHQVPPHINTVSFSGMNFFELTPEEFCKGLNGLPFTVHTLDFSKLSRNKRDMDQYKHLFSNIPGHIRSIKLCNNSLIGINPDSFKSWLAEFSPHITDIDFSGNGFDRILPSQFKTFTTNLPARISRVILNENLFALKTNGTLIAQPAIQYQQSLFKPKRVFLHFETMAEYRLVMNQVFKAKNLPLKTLILIFSFALDLTKQERENIERKLAIGIIAQKLPAQVTDKIRHESYTTALERIKLANSTRMKWVDLSRCGLNRINKMENIRTLFRNISENTTTLILRANGFRENDRTRSFLRQFLQEIPEQITHIDLSDNGFEYDTQEQLKTLLDNLSANVKTLSLDQGNPLSAKMHIATRNSPGYYVGLVSQHRGLMQQARSILDDYTKHDTPFMLFKSLHWHNRYHVAEVTQIVLQIEQGLITEISDVLSELNKINTSGDISLTKRINFLAKQSPKPIEEGMQIHGLCRLV